MKILLIGSLFRELGDGEYLAGKLRPPIATWERGDPVFYRYFHPHLNKTASRGSIWFLRYLTQPFHSPTQIHCSGANERAR